MQFWKKNIFINAIKARMKIENRTAKEVIEDYPKLTEEDKQEILNAIAEQ